jgi:ATP-dependent Clp protease adaptor protein ClpS
MLNTLFGHPKGVAMKMAQEVHLKHRCIVDTTSKERAELKRDQIHAFGPDSAIAHCAGSMSAEIEKAA